MSILFTDMYMPGSMNGFQLAEVVARNWPPIGIVVISGYGRATSSDLPEGGVFFPKPYDIEKVTAVLKRIAE
ncbi:MAG: response regulator [Alphaproteobacteria bacterium]|nr:MAG: response regulator [Alphaproteobacteria bacterium]